MIWETTRACDLVCRHCRAESVPARHPAELTRGERRASGTTSRVSVVPDRCSSSPEATRSTAPTSWSSSGPPPSGISTSLAPSVTSNLTGAALADLRAAGTKAVSLSLDGATAPVHDGFRGVDGVLEASVAFTQR